MPVEQPPGVVVGPDGVARCWWAGSDPLYVRYHDEEWGRPCGDDVRLFEKLCLEGFQAGLSWLTILRKREHFRAAFAGFDIDAVAGFGDADVARLLGDTGIVRHRGKIAATVNNAGRCRALREEFGSLAAYVWEYEPATTDRARAMSGDLRTRGWSFVGPTTAYSFMQAMGLVNDHLDGCAAREQVERDRVGFPRPVRRSGLSAAP
ncbi:MAG TPA: DNA-3-methyladenine glycosylase I [Candidatus Dormibacteraeota bacterium]